MNRALKEANALQERIDKIDVELAKPHLHVTPKPLVDTKETLEKVLEVVQKDLAEVKEQINEEIDTYIMLRNEVLSALQGERQVLVQAQATLLINATGRQDTRGCGASPITNKY